MIKFIKVLQIPYMVMMMLRNLLHVYYFQAVEKFWMIKLNWEGIYNLLLLYYYCNNCNDYYNNLL